MEIILASASPRRQELMKWITSDFTVLPADVEEIIPEEMPVMEQPRYLSEIKASAVAKEHPQALVIGADTLVICDGIAMGKPHGHDEAFSMLKKLSDRKHQVVTGCTVIYKGKKTSFSETTDVFFYSLSDQEIEDYIATGDPFDKAGGYGIQSYGIVLVKKIEGDYANVVGFPVARLSREIERMIKDE